MHRTGSVTELNERDRSTWDVSNESSDLILSRKIREIDLCADLLADLRRRTKRKKKIEKSNETSNEKELKHKSKFPTNVILFATFVNE